MILLITCVCTLSSVLCTPICVSKLPHANLLTLHTILNMYCHNDNIRMVVFIVVSIWMNKAKLFGFDSR